MTDDTQIEWKVTAMDCYPNLSGQKDYVFYVHWDCLSSYSGISGGPFYGRSFGATNVPESTGLYTPYDELTETGVLSWIWSIIGEDGKNSYEQQSLSQIYDKLNPPIITPPLPWSSGINPI